MLRRLVPEFCRKKLVGIGSPTPPLMALALKQCGNSSPGPSLLPFAAFRRTLGLSSLVLCDASSALEDGHAPNPPRDFQLCTLCLLLKKKFEVNPEVGVAATVDGVGRMGQTCGAPLRSI